MDVKAPLVTNSSTDEMNGTEEDWRTDLLTAGNLLKDTYALDDKPAISEIIAVFFVISDALHKVIASDRIMTERSWSADELQEFVMAAIIGAITGPGACHLSALVSSQIDADKLDYLARDAHHSGLEIGFDTDRLLARLEILRVRVENLDGADDDLLKRATEAPEGTFHQLGIAASGFGSFEQMLIGRTFLYDRLYHHHKVRSAEAMAQRLMLVAERDRRRRFDLGEIFLGVDDDTMLRLFSREIVHGNLEVPQSAASELARGIIDRRLLHRAFAFRGRFIASPPGLDRKSADGNRQTLWAQIAKDLATLADRYRLGEAVHRAAIDCCNALIAAGADKERWERQLIRLNKMGPEQVIVDLPGKKAEAIRILARYPNGAIRVPEFSFNPVKWSDAYDLQKRTGYVFCPKDVVGIMSLASKIVFLRRFGVVMAEEADGFIKVPTTPDSWIAALVNGSVIDQTAADHLLRKRHSLIRLRSENLKIPNAWIADDEDLGISLVLAINNGLKSGLMAEHLDAFSKVMEAMFAFVDMWYADSYPTSELKNEAELQQILRRFFAARSLSIAEGTRVGGGALDLWVEDAVLVENKFKDDQIDPEHAFPAAGAQGRRYAIALGAQVIIVVGAVRAGPGKFWQKTAAVSARKIFESDENRTEIRFILPFGAVLPSREKTDPALAP